MQEIWKDIQGFEGLYQISNLARVKRSGKSSVGVPKWAIKGLKKEQIKKPNKSIWGYLMVNLYKRGVCRPFSIHRLVAIHFIKNLNNYPIINHINGIKDDNRIENLEWCTYSENLKHAFRTGLKKVSKTGLGKTNELNVNSVPIVQKNLDGTKVREFPSIAEAHRFFGKQTNIPSALSGKQTQSCGFKWEYA